MVTFFPWKGLGISLGNSVIYSSQNVQPAYLIPFLFYNAVGQTLSTNNNVQDNYQLFLEISSRNLKRLHAYLTLFVDEFKVSRVTSKDQWNFLSWKGGVEFWDFPVRNLSVIAEFYWCNPSTYQHFIPAEQYTSNEYCLGDYLRDNSAEIFASLTYKPILGLSICAWFNYSIHGEEHQYGDGTPPDMIKPLVNQTWKNSSIGLFTTYEFINRGSISLQYQYNDHYGNTRRQPELFHGRTNSFNIRLTLGI